MADMATELYVLDELPPAAAEYVDLRRAAGMGARTVAAAQAGLPNSLYAACIRSNGTLVAMGRVVGDGGCNFEVVDIAVHPDHQRRGLGRRVMASLMTRVRSEAPPSAYVCLIADGGSPALYAEFGFTPTAPASIGMAVQL